MGNCAQLTSHNELEQEIALKRNERTVMFIGNTDAGKMELIRRIVDLYSSTTDRAKFIRSRYQLESFTITESTDPCIAQYASKSIKYLNAIHQHRECYYQTPQDDNVRSVQSATMHLQEALKQQQSDKAPEREMQGAVDDECLVFGYIHQLQPTIHLPFEIVQLLLMYYQTLSMSTVRSFKLQIGTKEVQQLWCVNGDDFMLSNCTLLFPWVHRLVFVIDLLSFNIELQINGTWQSKTTQFEKELVICEACIDHAMAYQLEDVLTGFVVVMTNKQRFQKLLQGMSATEFVHIFKQKANTETEKYSVAVQFLTDMVQRTLDINLQCVALDTSDKHDVQSFCNHIWTLE